MLTGNETKALQETEFRLLLPTISRWNIIDMRRKQNVAEHTYGVGVLALSLYDFMQNDVPHNSFDRSLLIDWAIDHDMDEIRSGDMPAPMKAALEAIHPGIVELAADQTMGTALPSRAVKKLANDGTYPFMVVKIADKVEEVRYNSDHGYDWRAKVALVDGLRLLRERLLKAETAHPRYDWGRARKWLAFMLRDVLITPGVVLPDVESLLAPA